MAAQEPVPSSTPAPGRPGDEPSTPTLAPPPARLRMSWAKRIFAALFVLLVAAVTALSLRPRPPVPLEIQTVVARARPHHPRGHRRRQAPGRDRGEALLQPLGRPARAAGPRGRPGQEGAGARRASTPAATPPRWPRREAARAERRRRRWRASGSSSPQLAAGPRARASAWPTAGNASGAELENARADARRRGLAAPGGARSGCSRPTRRSPRPATSSPSPPSPRPSTASSPSALKQVGERVRGSDFSEDVRASSSPPSPAWR